MTGDLLFQLKNLGDGQGCSGDYRGVLRDSTPTLNTFELETTPGYCK